MRCGGWKKENYFLLSDGKTPNFDVWRFDINNLFLYREVFGYHSKHAKVCGKEGK